MTKTSDPVDAKSMAALVARDNAAWAIAKLAERDAEIERLRAELSEAERFIVATHYGRERIGFSLADSVRIAKRAFARHEPGRNPPQA